jgi:hypothetical protein
MKILKTIFKGSKIIINKDNYVNAQYISKTLNDNDSKINYLNFIIFENVKYFKLNKK